MLLLGVIVTPFSDKTAFIFSKNTVAQRIHSLLNVLNFLIPEILGKVDKSCRKTVKFWIFCQFQSQFELFIEQLHLSRHKSLPDNNLFPY